MPSTRSDMFGTRFRAARSQAPNPGSGGKPFVAPSTAGRPEEGWVWPAPTQSGHISQDSLKLQHKKALRLAKLRPFEVYAIRHTFLTRLGESGCDVWTLARIAGHSSIAISARYVHPSSDAVLRAMARQAELSGTGDKTGDSAEIALQLAEPKPLLTS